MTTCSHLRWSIRPSLTANLSPALFLSLWIGYSDCDLRGWPMAPWGPPSLAPGRSSTQRSGRHLTGQKVERTRLAPHESNQAHREHIRTPGFYLPFSLFWPLAKSRLGRQVCQVPQLHPSDHITHGLWDSQRASWRILPIHVVGFHILRSPLKRYVGETFLAGMRQPEYNLKSFPKETFTCECSPTSTGVIEAERTALHIQSQDGNSSAAGDLELLFQNVGERGELSVGWRTKLKVNCKEEKGKVYRIIKLFTDSRALLKVNACHSNFVTGA